MDKNNNDLLLLGIFILFVGIALFSYSVVSFKEVKSITSQINLEELDDPRMSSTTKYDKRATIADFLMNKLEKYKTLPVKNTVCIYMDYAQNNLISIYNLTYNSGHSESYQKKDALKYLNNLSIMYQNYKTCKQYTEYNKELANLIDKAEKSSEEEYYRESKMENFLHGKTPNIERYTEGNMRDAARFPQDEAPKTSSVKHQNSEEQTLNAGIYQEAQSYGSQE